MLALKPMPDLGEQVAQCQRLARVLTLTKQMLGHADLGEWDAVTELEKERRDDLLACFSVSVEAADSDLIAEALAALLHLNEELMSKLKRARDVAMEQGASLSRNRQAVGHYQVVDSTR